MKLGLNLGYSSSMDRTWAADILAQAQAADQAGFDVLWVAEAYGSDSPSTLAWLAGQTASIGLGSAVMQIPGRTPAATAMTAATIDNLSGGRFRLGLGVSGPQVSEGWHGVRFTAPLGRTKEYVDIVRMALTGKPVEYAGTHFTLPLPDGPGKALRITIPRVRKNIPVYLAAVGPKNLELAGRIADGWLAIFFSPEHSGDQLDIVREGARRAGRGTPDNPLADFDVVPSLPVGISDDIEGLARRIAPYCALYIGGMGSREQNFYNQLACRMGFEKEAAQIQDLFLGGDPLAAARAVPFEFIDATSLIGTPQRVKERASRYAAAGVTTLAVTPVGANAAAKVDVIRQLGALLSSP